jgi:hypothetical protein
MFVLFSEYGIVGSNYFLCDVILFHNMYRHDFRMKLWDRFCMIRVINVKDKTFHGYWYDFLIRHFMSNGDSVEETFQKFSRE